MTTNNRLILLERLVVLLLVLAACVACDSGDEPQKPHAPQEPQNIQSRSLEDYLQQAAADHGTVSLVRRTYAVNRALTIPAGVTVRGNGAVLSFSGNAPTLVTLSSGSKLGGVTILSKGRTKSMVTVAQGAVGAELSNCQLLGSGRELVGVGTEASVSNLTIKDCAASDVRNVVQLNNGPTNVLIDGFTMQRWSTRGVRIQGTAEYAANNIVLRHLRIGPNVGDDASRYPITALSTGRRHRDITVEDSTVTGRNTAHDDPAHPGTADQISISMTDGVVVRNNRSIGGGERGINVSAASDVIIEGNYVNDADTCGIGIGATPTGDGVDNIVVRDNTVVDSGQSRQASTVDSSLTAIRLTRVTNGNVTGNTLVSSAGVTTQKYGITLDGSIDVNTDGNTFRGVMAKQFNDLQHVAVGEGKQ